MQKKFCFDNILYPPEQTNFILPCDRLKYLCVRMGHASIPLDKIHVRPIQLSNLE